MSARSLLITVLGVIVVAVAAWFLIDIVFSVLWFVAKIIIVAVIALIAFIAFRVWALRSERG